MRTTLTTPSLLEGFEAWLAGRPERDQPHRREAHALLRDGGYPTRRHEEWRFTALGPWAESRSPSAPSTVATAGFRAFDVEGLEAIDLEFIDGRLASVPEIPGVKIVVLGSDLGPEERPANSSDSRGDVPALELLNRAWSDRGVLVEVEPGVKVNHPLHFRFLSAAGSSTFTQPRVHLRLGRSSEVKVLEHHRSAGESTATNLHFEVELEEGARLEHVQLTLLGDSAAHATNLRAEVGRDATYSHWNFVLGGRWVRDDLHCRLAGEHSEMRLMGLAVAGGEQMIDTHTRVEHGAEHARSIEEYRHVVDDQARVVFAGRVVVEAQVRDSDARQTNANLLLSPDARVNALPQLEIYNDDVKASHGSSMGQLDEEALFYLRSRGIDEATARGLLLWGFANSVVEQLEWPALAQLIQHEVQGHLGEILSLEEES